MVNRETQTPEAVIRSMTGFASASGGADGWTWNWDMRAVNSRGLDLRFRLPDWIEGLEPALRGFLKQTLARGSVQVGLKVSRSAEAGALRVDDSTLDAVLAEVGRIEQRALEFHDLELSPTSAAELLAMRALADASAAPADTTELSKALIADFKAVFASFDDMRRREGAALAAILTQQIDQIAALTNEAVEAAAERAGTSARKLRENLARVLANANGADPDRVAQELALIALKSDVTEELDRLQAHCDAARALLRAGGAVGRKLDFLAQEFNREANTLCSKSQSVELTRIGLDLKAATEQMREQVQNVE